MKKTLLAITLCVATATAYGQGQTVSGQILDAAGKPVIGATVVEKGTNNGTATDNDGRFVLKARTAAPRLQISSIGYGAQEVAGSGQVSVRLSDSSTSLGDVQVVGSRSQNRSITDSPSPVDIIDLREVTTKTGQLDVNQLLQFVAPSFNSNRQTGSDGADHVDPASLRGLGPDQTLVLVNGKRQHHYRPHQPARQRAASATVGYRPERLIPAVNALDRVEDAARWGGGPVRLRCHCGRYQHRA